MTKFLTIIFLTFGISAQALTFQSVKSSQAVKLEVKLHKINQHIILDPRFEETIVSIGSKKYKFKSKDLFFKKNRGEIKIFGRTGKYFIHVTSRDLNLTHSHLIINIRDRVLKQTNSIKGIFLKNPSQEKIAGI